MPTSTTRIPTPNGSKYLQQLCKHWGHKLTVEFDPQKGRVEFDPTRQCRFEAAPEHLDLFVETATGEELERTQGTLINHLKRFAFREELGEPGWTQTS